VTFEAINEEAGVEGFLRADPGELVSRRYLPAQPRKEDSERHGKVRRAWHPCIGTSRPGCAEAHPGADFRRLTSTGFVRLRPARTQQEAVCLVTKAITEEKDKRHRFGLKGYFDNVRHHILLAKLAQRVRTGTFDAPAQSDAQGHREEGSSPRRVIFHCLSNIYLNEVDRMVSGQREKTREGRYTRVEYASMLTISSSWWTSIRDTPDC